ncbi:MAG: hypothetical protein JW786_13830 [Desulfobacterales bacterium]|nr:hypothetical protein [Desulfobacterales bacterium]
MRIYIPVIFITILSLVLLALTNPTVSFSSNMSEDFFNGLSSDTFLFSGQIKNETAYRTSHPNQITKLKNILNINLLGDITTTVSYNLSSRFYYDAVFDLSGNYNKEVENNQEKEAKLRTAFLDFNLGDVDLRIGKQQIVWGEAVGLFFADIINPKDLREFILPELGEIRIPTWATDIEYYFDDNYFEFVWIPVPKFNKFGTFGSEFDFERLQSIQENISVIYLDKKEPSSNLKNSEFGFRISRLIGNWDLSMFYFYGYDYFPVNFRGYFSNSSNPNTVIMVSPEYKKINISGMTFSSDFNNVILKGEFIFNNNKYFEVSDPLDTDGVVKKDYLDYILGMNYTFFDRIDSNFQLMQRIIFNYDKKILEDDVTVSFSIWLKTSFLNNTLEPEIFFVSSLNKKDLMIRPKLSYTFADNCKLTMGIDIFEGVSDGYFGQFDDKDRIYLELSFDF